MILFLTRPLSESFLQRILVGQKLLQNVVIDDPEQRPKGGVKPIGNSEKSNKGEEGRVVIHSDERGTHKEGNGICYSI